MRRRDLLRGLGGLSILGMAGCATSGSSGAPAGATGQEEAFYYGFPIYEFARTAQQRTAAPNAINQVVHRAALADHTSRQVTAPNNDTIYSSAFLDLSGGPVEVVSPTDTKRYFNIAFMDAFTDNFAYIGTRATEGQGGTFWVAGPEWHGSAPAGVRVLRSSTNDVWMLGRTLVDGPEDMAAARAVQQQITVRPTSDKPARPYGVRATDAEDPAVFLGVVNEMIARSPGGKGHLARAPRFARYGIGAPASAEAMAAWPSTIQTGIARMREKFEFRDLVMNGWGYQDKGVGAFEASDFLRASIALGGLAALGEEEAMYFQAMQDGSGAKLDGNNSYVWRVPPGGVPTGAFWSLTMYQAEADGRFFLVDNPIRRYSIGDRTKGLKKNPDGSIDILMQPHVPEGDMAGNWLPTPSGPMRLSLRAYLPKPELRERRWRVPPVVRA